MGGMKGVVTAVVEGLSQGVAVAMQMGDELMNAIDGANIAFASFMQTLGHTANNDLFNPLLHIPGEREALQRDLAKLANLSATAQASLDARALGGGAGARFLKWVDDAKNKANGLAKNLKTGMDGIDRGSLELEEFNRKLKFMDEMKSKGKGLMESFQSPLEKFFGSTRDLTALRQLDIFGEAEVVKGVAQALDGLEGTVSKTERNLPAAMLRGSKEAYSAIVKARRATDEETAQQRIERLMKEAALRDKSRNERLDEIQKALANPKIRQLVFGA
jgi:hypothetical protein